MKIAIVSTLRDHGNVLRSFVHYHERIGIHHFYLFFDEPDSPNIRFVSKKNITAIRNDLDLEERWKRTRRYSALKEFLAAGSELNQDRVLAKQELNVEVAISLALEENVDWLIHLDIDELFFIPAKSVREHFESLERKKIEHVTYRNYEAVPEGFSTHNYFKDATLFKRNPAHLDESQRALMQREKGLPFTSYRNGKSAARIKKDLLPLGVHQFDSPKRVFLREKENGSTATEMVTRFPIILHYPNCGFENFLKKYRNLGAFRNKWYGITDMSRNVPFHLQARDVVMRNDREEAKRFYQNRIMIKDSSLIERWIRKGILCRITGPSVILKGSSIRG